MIEKTSKLAEKNVNGLYRNSVISAILGAETAENGPEHLKYPQLVLKYPQWTPRGAKVYGLVFPRHHFIAPRESAQKLKFKIFTGNFLKSWF